MKKICFSAVALLLALTFAFSAFANGNTVENNAEVYGAIYTDYTITGQSSGKTADVHCIEFSPESGLVPMAYAANSGAVTLLADHVAHAEANGYTVVGAINGSFFEMATGNPCGTLISDGKLVFTHATLSETVGVFGYDGSFNIIGSCLQFKFLLSGKNVPAGIGLVNKKYSACESFNKNISGRFHYYDIDACDLADETVTGYEIVCEKLDGTELSVGRTLSAKVLEVKTDSYYGATKIAEENKFVLFLRSDSAKFASRAAEVKVGDEVSITPTESDSLFADITNNAQSAISSSYWLVENGVDKTDTLGTIVHSTSLARAWTAFGIKADGTYVYWASSEVDAEGNNALTLKDVADAMIAMGCVNVIRLDGGGSTGIYIKDNGEPITTTRKVCDALLIVKAEDLKSEAPSAEPETSEPEASKPEDNTSAPEASAPVESENPEDTSSESPEAPEASDSSTDVSDESAETNENSGEDNSDDNGGSSNAGLIIAIVIVAVVIIAVVVVIVVVKKKKK